MLLTIICDMPVSRRLSINHILDEHDVLRFSSARIGPCLAWCHETGYEQFDVETTEGRFRINIEKLPEE